MLQFRADAVRAQELQEAFPVLLRNRLIGISRQLIPVGKLLTGFQHIVNADDGLIADAAVLIQVDIVQAAVVGTQGGNQPVLLLMLSLLLQELLLEMQLLLQFLMLDSALYLCRLLLKSYAGILPRLEYDHGEQAEQYQCGQRRLHEAASDDTV